MRGADGGYVACLFARSFQALRWSFPSSRRWPLPRRRSKAALRAVEVAEAFSPCCQPMRLATMCSTPMAKAFPIRRQQVHLISSARTASAPRRSSTPPMSPRTGMPADRSPSSSMAGRALPQPLLSLGLVGPRILDFGPSGRDGANAKLVDNPQSWLNFTDLVLIDPIGTGWSRTVKSDDAKEFYSVRADAESLCQGDRALCCPQRTRRLAEIYSRRELWRAAFGKSRHQLAAGSGHPDFRHRHAVAVDRRAARLRSQRSRTRSGARIAFAGRCRVGAEKCLQRAGGSGRRKICAERISAHSCRPASDRRCRSCVLRPRGQADRHSRGCRC